MNQSMSHKNPTLTSIEILNKSFCTFTVPAAISVDTDFIKVDQYES